MFGFADSLTKVEISASDRFGATFVAELIDSLWPATASHHADSNGRWMIYTNHACVTGPCIS